MSVEIQIKAGALADTAERNLQKALHGTCHPPLGDFYIDHVDVVPGRSRWEPGPVLRTAVQVYVVSLAEAIAAADGVPPGAQRPAGEIELGFRLSCTGGAVALECVDAQPDAAIITRLGPVGPGLRQEIIRAIGAPARANLAPILAPLGLGDIGSSAAELAGDTILIRINPAGPAMPRILPGHEWALCLDRAALARIGTAMVPSRIPGLTSHQTSAEWTTGLTGESLLMLRVTGKVDVPEPATATFQASLACRLSLGPGVPGRLRADVRWDAEVDLGGGGTALILLDDLLTPGIPGVADSIRQLIWSKIDKAFDPALFGGERTGRRTFTIDKPLPLFDLADSRMHADELRVSTDGIVLGGSVARPVDIGRRTVIVSHGGWKGGGQAVTFCSEGATGDDTPYAHLFRSAAEIEYASGGRLCEAVVVSHPNLTPYLHLPKVPGSWDPLPGDGTVTMIMSSVFANEIASSVRVLIRTSRGVRVADLGRPAGVTVNADGTVPFGSVIYIDDCLAAPPPADPDNPLYAGLSAIEIIEIWERWSGVWDYWSGCPGWVHDLLAESEIDIAALAATDTVLLDRSWEAYTSGREFLDLQLAEVRGLDPGEVIVFRSPDHLVQVTAGSDGIARVPYILPVGRKTGTARTELYRLNRARLPRSVRTKSVIFEALVSESADTWVEVDPNGDAYIGRDIGGELQFRVLDRSGVLSTAPAEISGRRRPTATSVTNDFGLAGVRKVIALPGFDDAPLRIVTLDDGSKLIMDTSGVAPRVAGTFQGPIGEVAVADNWAVIRSATMIDVYRVRTRT